MLDVSELHAVRHMNDEKINSGDTTRQCGTSRGLCN